MSNIHSLKFSIEVWGTDVLCAVEVFGFAFGGEAGWQSVFAQDVPDAGLKGGSTRDFAGEFTETCQGPAVYYLRVRQKYLVRDRPAYAWSSPIWVNCE